MLSEKGRVVGAAVSRVTGKECWLVDDVHGGCHREQHHPFERWGWVLN